MTEVTEVTGAVAAPTAPTAARVRRLAPALRYGAIALAALLIGAGYPGWLLAQQHRRDTAATAALAAARDYAVTLTSADPDTVDEKVDAIIAGATGDFKDRYTKSSAQLRKLMIDNQVSTRGTVRDAAVKSATADRVEVLLVVEQAVSNKAVSALGTDLTPVAITMQNVAGSWLAADVVVFGAEP